MTKFRGFFSEGGGLFSSSVSRRETQCEINTKHSRTNVEGYSVGCSNTHKKAEFREANFFLQIFFVLQINNSIHLITLNHALNNAESHDVKR